VQAKRRVQKLNLHNTSDITMLTPEQRRHFGLPAQPPPAHEPLDLTVIDHAYRRAVRRRRRITLLTLIPVAMFEVVLYLLDVPGVVLAMVPGLIGGGAAWLLERQKSRLRRDHSAPKNKTKFTTSESGKP